jgi:hypothetical protein
MNRPDDHRFSKRDKQLLGFLDAGLGVFGNPKHNFLAFAIVLPEVQSSEYIHACLTDTLRSRPRLDPVENELSRPCDAMGVVAGEACE